MQLARAAFVSIALACPVHAQGATPDLICSAPTAFCSELSDGLSALGIRNVTRFALLTLDQNQVRGRLEWLDDTGRWTQGPELELSVMDVELSARDIMAFSQRLLRISPLPR